MYTVSLQINTLTFFYCLDRFVKAQPLSLLDEYFYGIISESERLDSRGKATQVPSWISWHDSWHWRPWPCLLRAPTPTQTLLAKSNPMPLPVCHPSPSQNIPEGTIYLLVSVRPHSGFPPLSLARLQQRHGMEPKYDMHLIVHAKINRNTEKIHFTTLPNLITHYPPCWTLCSGKWRLLFFTEDWWFMTAYVSGLFVWGWV